ncbi:hypothetical protein I302_103013 [Kwoniella bestiolae CBS 10118]|uniref:HPP transmembrane region domain-containing protein n=1 Tax=Kwoniella bestiolae CBS 10118 TaxID=1296100 RepID=A0A1B9GGL4_9TREE|nr:hypothetical protein I302_01709 [Kwoniella bestiolae CBS 10118]OCF30190.1 hypothetical protein I302_01709 [Kwoniella bestiolae CBS 10118]
MNERQTRFDIAPGNASSRGWSASQSTVRPSPSPYNKDRSRSRSRSRIQSNSRSRSPSAIPSSSSRLVLSEDYRSRLPPILSRFIGYRPPGAVPPYDPLPIPPFTWLNYISLKYEIWLFSFLGSFGGILLVEAICSTNTVFRNVYGSPMIVGSFGAACILLFGVIESPLAQPRNHILGNLLGAIIGVCLTKLFTLNGGLEEYRDRLERNDEFGRRGFVNGGLTVGVTMLFTSILGVVHPPAGATALAASTDPLIMTLSWNYIPIVLCSSLLLIAWALIINNLGRRRYPVYWWNPQRYFVKPDPEPERGSKLARGRSRESEELALKSLEEGRLRRLEDGGRSPEALLVDRIQGRGGSLKDVVGASDGLKEDQGSGWKGVHEPLGKTMSRHDRELAEGVDEFAQR